MPFIEIQEESPLISVFENETSGVQGMTDAYSRRFIQRMKALENRYSKFLSLNGRVSKRSLERDYQDALEIS